MTLKKLGALAAALALSTMASPGAARPLPPLEPTPEVVEGGELRTHLLLITLIVPVVALLIVLLNEDDDDEEDPISP